MHRKDLLDKATQQLSDARKKEETAAQNFSRLLDRVRHRR